MTKHDGEPAPAALLLRDPLAFNARRITVEGFFTYGFEHSRFLGAWVEPPADFYQQHLEAMHWSSGYSGFVRITGQWHARPKDHGGFGHLGVSDSCLSAERIDEIPLQPRTSLGPGQLRSHLQSLEGELVEAVVPVVTGHLLCRFDDLPDQSIYQHINLERQGCDPTEQLACLLLWIECETPRILRCQWRGEARPYPVPRVAVAELPTYAGHIVEAEGALEVGKYWPRLGACELVPPEISTTNRLPETYCWSTPPPPEIEQWRQRIAAGGGALRVLVRGRVLDDGKKLSAYRLQLLPST